jgi:hypothetical protein
MERKNFLRAALCTIFFVFSTNAETIFNKKTVHLQLDMRKLWEDHIVWTRNVIISSIANLLDLDAVTQRLLQNQDDIGDAFKPYFGKKVGNELSELLREHIVLAAAVIADAIANNTQQLNIDYEEWQKNARDIAKFLSKKNHHWSKKELKNMLYEHLELTTGEVTSRLQGDWDADIDFYDKNHDHMLMFSDILTEGIVKKFPDKF